MTTVQADRSDRPGYPVPRPDEAHWPGLATPPRAPLRARVADLLATAAPDGIDVFFDNVGG